MTMSIADPLDAKVLEYTLPTRCELLGNASLQESQHFLVDIRTCVAANLAVMSLACGKLVVVKTPSGYITPPTLFVMCINESGDGKTPVMNRSFKPLYDAENRLYSEYEEHLDDYESHLAAWKVEERRLAREERNCPGFPGQLDEIEERQRLHRAQKPRRPRVTQLLYEDVTKSGFVDGLSVTGVGLVATSEGAIVTESGALDCVPMFNSLHSGAPVTVNRGRSTPLRLRNCRLSILIMIQRAILDGIPKKKWEKLLESGFFARFFIFLPASMKGTRLSRNRTHGTEYVERFGERACEMMETTLRALDDDEFSPEVIEFDAEASEYFLTKADAIELAMGKGGQYEFAASHASKLAEMAARLAGLLHYFEGYEGKIGKQTVEIAFDICEECSRNYVALFAKRPEEETDEEALLEKMNDYRESGLHPVLKNKARQGAPAPLRGKRFYAALNRLEKKGKLRVVRGADGKDYIFFTEEAPPCGLAPNGGISGLL